ncbi:MAG: phage tail protein [Bacteroidetes bacterium]|uniref:phage tail protein n=1 Tax=Phnomibacter sp. TaxID=2836217 RepID=UPI002FDDABE5|nr:phage tail protein [Bacteroidota bacterium]
MLTFLLIGVLVLLAALLLLLVLWYLTYKNTLVMTTPLPNYHFDVQFGGVSLRFTEITGLDLQVEVIDFRDGASPEYNTRKMPGQHRYSNLILKRGIVTGDTDFFDWMKTVQSGKPERRDLTVRLLNEEHNPVYVWKLRNAFPVRYSGPHFNSMRSEAAIETLEIAYDGMDVQSTA